MSKEKQERKKSSKLFVSKYIDQFIFKKIDLFYESQSYQKLSDKFSELDPNSQKIVNYGLTFLFLALPFFLIFTMFSKNSELKEEYELKKEIISTIHSFRDKKTSVDSLITSLGSPVEITSQQDLNSKMSSRLRGLNISGNQIQIDEFHSSVISSSLNETTVRFNLRDLTLVELTQFFNLMLNDYRMKTKQIEIERDKHEKLLSGNVEFVHLQRGQSEDSGS